MLSLLLPAAALLSWPDPRARTRLAAVRPSNALGFGSGSTRVRAVPIAVSCGVVVAALLDPRWRIEIEAEAVLTQRDSHLAPPTREEELEMERLRRQL